ncbi:MAG: septum formation initiator family protein [Bacteroidales bacterium]|nr:septum formation initiator family protein [Bacteroidales bacterium]
MSVLGDKIRELKSRHSIFRFILNKWAIATIVFLVIICFVDRNNVFNLARTNSTLRSQKRQEIYLREAIQSTGEKIDQLKSNADTLEMFARENYYFQEKNEDVYIVK